MISALFSPDASPYVEVEVRVPGLSASGTLLMLMDTGADGTSLHLWEALSLLGEVGLRQLGRLNNVVRARGIGGSAAYFVEPAEIVLKHDDGMQEGFHLDLKIVKPARRGSMKRDMQLKIPSLLGKDIMTQFNVVFDWPRGQVYLD